MLDIQKIVNKKVTSMLNNKEIQQSINDKKTKFKIASIYEDKAYLKDLTKQLKLGIINPFEKLLISAYYNETPFVQIEESTGSFEMYEN